MPAGAENLDLDNYARIARRICPNSIGLALCDADAGLITASSDEVATLAGQAVAARGRVPAEATETGVLELADGRHALLYPLEVRPDERPLALAWIRDAGGVPVPEQGLGEFTPGLPLIAALRNELSLHAELDDMANELAERYEELNLVYDTDERQAVLHVGHEAVMRLLDDCTSYMGAGRAALLMRERSQVILGNDGDSKVDAEPLLEALGDELREHLLQQFEPGVINHPQRADEAYFRALPVRMVSVPVLAVTGDRIDGVLMLFNPADGDTFSNSDKNLLTVMGRRASKILATTYDQMTGMLNRQSFERILGEELRNSWRGTATHCLLHVNIDGLHRINDTLGMDAGDRAIVAVARTIGARLRDSDHMARLGGDEIGILLRRCTASEAETIAEQLRAAVDEADMDIGEEQVRVRVSIGLTQFGSGELDIELLLKRCAIACGLAKEKGGNRVQPYQTSDTALMRRESAMWMAGKVSEALANDRFELHGQLIAPLHPDHGMHVEVLVRMREDGKLIGPDKFIVSAERYQLMQELDDWITRRALDMLQAALPAHPALANVVWGINLSGQTIGERQFGDRLVRMIGASGVPANRLCFEITETAAVSNLHAAKVFISQLRTAGCQVALDDFGAGMSSFGYLKSFDVDYLKIDGSLIREILKEPVTRAMVRSINDIGHVMGLRTIAEYVETDDLKTALDEMGVDFAQGFAIGRPAPLEEIMRQLAGVAATGTGQ